MITTHCSLNLQGSSDPPPQPPEWLGLHHHIPLIFVFFVKMEFYHVSRAGLELLGSGEPPASVSQSARITDMSIAPGPKD